MSSAVSNSAQPTLPRKKIADALLHIFDDSKKKITSHQKLCLKLLKLYHKVSCISKIKISV